MNEHKIGDRVTYDGLTGTVTECRIIVSESTSPLALPPYQRVRVTMDPNPRHCREVEGASRLFEALPERPWNPVYVEYAAAHGKSPADMLAADKAKHPGACMMEFILWNEKRRQPGEYR
jgi:hypothetical protein